MPVEKQWIVNLKGKDYPMWPGILDFATKSGLRSLRTRVIQIPHVDNGHMAVVMAVAEFEDGRIFEDVGDASPANCSPQIATAALRMASTRSMGRVLRTALNIGDTMYEELPDEERRSNANGASESRHTAPPRQEVEQRATTAANPSRIASGAIACAECGLVMTPAQNTMSVRLYKRPLCPEHQKAAARILGTTGTNPAV